MDYTTLASKEAVEKTTASLTANSFMPEVLATKEAALARIKELIPAGASVMNGASRTLEQIGYVEYLKAKQHGWSNIHDAILEETDDAKKADMRKMGVLSDFYLGSVHALTEDGQLVISSNSGSQLPHLAYTSPNLILVVSTEKITPTLTDAFLRIEKHVVPLEDERMKAAYGYGTMRTKTLILHKENPGMGRKVHVLLVEEKLGF
jgi:L-lactate utilization protein LutC